MNRVAARIDALGNAELQMVEAERARLERTHALPSGKLAEAAGVEFETARFFKLLMARDF